MHQKFKLAKTFVDGYVKKNPPFGFSGLGALVFQRTYSRIKEDGTNEEWYECVERVVNGCYNMQKEWIETSGLYWNSWKAQKSAQEMYDRMYNMKFLPPGRGLYAMGSSITEDKKMFAALNNCAMISTDEIDKNFSEPFCFLMDMSMLGVGCGFDTKGAEKVIIKGINKNRKLEKYIIPDSREGWVESVKMILEAYVYGLSDIEYDYSLVRKEGELIKGFGGISSGPKPLIELHDSIRIVLDKEIGKPISVRAIVDIMNMIGKCIISGNIRRTAEIVFGDYKNNDYLDLKNYKINPDREAYGWTSNNSIFADLGMDYTKVVDRTKVNGEPGYVWLENIRSYSRMKDDPDNKDFRAAGCNPCSEQSLESWEICCLVENFPMRCIDKEDFLRTLKFAYLYAKTVTLGKTHWPQTNRVMLRNRRIGCSLSGLAQFITKHGLDTLKDWCVDGYNFIEELDAEYSNFFAIPKSIKKTSIKPSGSISLLAGATAGMHYPESRFYIRRVRISKTSTLVDSLKKAGYVLEEDVSDNSSLIVSFPIDVGEGVRTLKDVSMWEQISLAAFLQKYWADNQVSCTVTFKKEEADQIIHALDYMQWQLKGISFLPRLDKKSYAQMPYEEINEEIFKKEIAKIKKINFKQIKGELVDQEKFCDGESCLIKSK